MCPITAVWMKMRDVGPGMSKQWDCGWVSISSLILPESVALVSWGPTGQLGLTDSKWTSPGAPSQPTHHWLHMWRALGTALGRHGYGLSLIGCTACMPALHPLEPPTASPLGMEASSQKLAVSWQERSDSLPFYRLLYKL